MNVETITSIHAIIPINLAFGSLEREYFNPGHFDTTRKQIKGRMMLNA